MGKGSHTVTLLLNPPVIGGSSGSSGDYFLNIPIKQFNLANSVTNKNLSLKKGDDVNSVAEITAYVCTIQASGVDLSWGTAHPATAFEQTS